MSNHQRKPLSMSGTILVTASLVVIAAMFLTPVIWMACTSMKSPTDAAQGGLSPLPGERVVIQEETDESGKTIAREVHVGPARAAMENIVHNYPEVWNDPSITFPIYLRNTLIIAVLSVTGMVLSSAVVAYGFARLNFKGRGAMFVVVLATMMIPFPVVMAPLYLVFRELGWIGTLKPLWVPAWFGGAFNIFLLRQFFMGIPKELDEAAKIDGCSHFGIFWRIILPLSKPALAVVALFHFMFVWNDFLGPLIFLTHRDDFTLALGLQLYQSKAGNTPWNLLMAASTMVTIPVLVLYVLAQRTFVRGMSADGLKE